MITSTKILDECGATKVHFLKIDGEGTEARVSKGLTPDSLRPRIIVVDATEANFVRWTEWSSTSTVARLEQEVADLHSQASGLAADLKSEQAQTANLRNALLAEQARTAELNDALRAEGVERSYLCGRLRQFESLLAAPSVDRAIGRVLRLGRDAGNRVTGGGVRALTKRTLKQSLRRAMGRPALVALGRLVLKPFPTLTTTLYQIAKTENGGTALRSPVEGPTAPPILLTPQESVSLFTPPIPDLPPSAKPVYLNLQAAMRDSAPWRRLG